MNTAFILKRTSLAIVLFFFIASASAQKLILADDVNSTLLKNICDDAAIKVDETKDTYIKVKETFEIYIDIDSKKRFLYMNISYPLVAEATPSKVYQLMNKLNREIILMKCYYNPEKNTVNYAYDFWIESGFTNRTFINAIKMLSSALSLSLEKDTDKLIK